MELTFQFSTKPLEVSPACAFDHQQSLKREKRERERKRCVCVREREREREKERGREKERETSKWKIEFCR